MECFLAIKRNELLVLSTICMTLKYTEGRHAKYTLHNFINRKLQKQYSSTVAESRAAVDQERENGGKVVGRGTVNRHEETSGVNIFIMLTAAMISQAQTYQNSGNFTPEISGDYCIFQKGFS